MMAQPVPPPLPPKTRRAPPESTTVLAKTVVSSSREESLVCSIPEVTNHVVKIRINPDQLNEDSSNNIGCIRISVNSEEMISTDKNYFFYSNDMTSGQVSPSDTLDSGTCSDLDGTPPPLPKKKSAVSVTLIGQHKLSTQELDSDNDSNLSCDSLNSSELQAKQASAYLPQGLLKDIRNRSTKLTQSPETIPQEPIEEPLDEQQLEKPLDKSHKQRHYAETQYEEQKTVLTSSPKVRIDENSYQMRKVQQKEETDKLALEKMLFDTDKFYNFHLNEKTEENHQDKGVTKSFDDETFAGYKDLLGSEGMKTIRSAKGTVRGVKNRVRAGIATFLQINSTTKNYKDKDMGKVVVYTTTMGIVRETYNACMKVKQILRTLLIKYEERDVFMSGDYQGEIRDRMRSEYILVPQVFVDGQHIGDAETIERLNETGELRRILKPFKSLDVCSTCQVCGGYRLLPCPVCNGSKKSVHRNHFTTEFVALKCMNCDEVGLVKCNSC